MCSYEQTKSSSLQYSFKYFIFQSVILLHIAKHLNWDQFCSWHVFVCSFSVLLYSGIHDNQKDHYEDISSLFDSFNNYNDKREAKKWIFMEAAHQETINSIILRSIRLIFVDVHWLRFILSVTYSDGLQAETHDMDPLKCPLCILLTLPDYWVLFVARVAVEHQLTSIHTKVYKILLNGCLIQVNDSVPNAEFKEKWIAVTRL